MSAKKGYLFSMDLRIYNEIIKLRVYEDDTVADVIDRLASSMTGTQSSKQKLKAKLEDQFRKIVQKTDLSETVKAKLDSLLDQSKIIIVNIDTDKNDNHLTETPFRILQESGMGRKVASEKIKKNYHYSQAENPYLNLKYDSQQFGSEIGHNLAKEREAKTMIVRTKNAGSLTPNKYDYLEVKAKDETSTEIFQKKYEALDRKCQNFITKNIPTANIPLSTLPVAYKADFSSPLTQYQSYIPYEQRSLQRKVVKRERVRQDDIRGKETGDQKRFLRVISENEYEKYREPIKANESFHNYKINRYKSNNIGQLATEKFPQPQLKYNRQNILPSKSYTKLNYATENNTATTIKNYPNTTSTIRNYDAVIEAKLLPGTVSSKKLKGKFNYLGA